MNDIFVILILIMLNGVFSMAEIAMISARKSRLTADAKHGSRGAQRALRLADDPDRFLSTIQIGITLIGILTGLYSGAALAEDVGGMLERLGLAPRVAHAVGQIGIVTVVTYLSIVVGELVPKRMGLASANTVAKLISRPMYILSLIAMPAVWLLSASTSFIVRLFGIKSRENNVTEDEIRSLIKDGTEAGEVRKVEQDIMERALVLGDLRVSSIMTPKVDVSALRLDMTADEIRVKLSQELHTAYPVYCNRKGDTICGIVSLKQLILKIDSSDFRLRDVVTSPTYFPESMSVYDALDHMKVNKESFALVCDEFGDMSGLITPSDILDGLVGAMPQQTVTPDIRRDDKIFAWVVDAQIPIYDFINYFDLEELYKPSSYSTLGGLILEELRHVPEVGEKFEWNHIGFEVLSMKGARIEKVRVILPHSCGGG